jgi:hypothetical protein
LYLARRRSLFYGNQQFGFYVTYGSYLSIGIDKNIVYGIMHIFFGCNDYLVFKVFSHLLLLYHLYKTRYLSEDGKDYPGLWRNEYVHLDGSTGVRRM